MWSENSQKISKHKMKVRIWAANGRNHEGYMFVKQGERLSDLLNDTREFLPFTVDEDTVLFLRKSAIVEVEQIGDAEAIDHQPSQKDFGGMNRRSTQQFADQPIDPIQAAEILGLSDGYTREDVLAAYREMIQKVHPDHGGSSFLAAQVNAAKRILTQEYA